MPFTFSHPALILPLAALPKRWASLTGLVIGSLAPDFEYFLRMKVNSVHSHTLPGVFYFNLPLAIILSFAFHLIVRDQLIENLPLSIKGRLDRYRRFNWINHVKKYPLTVIISILVGVFSHILWDSFTHEHGYFVEKLPYLSKKLQVNNLAFPCFKLLQHSSTLAGGLLIIFTVLRIPINNPDKQNSKTTKYWLIVLVISLAIIALRFANEFNIKQYGNLIVTGISAGFIALTLTSLLKNFMNRH